MSDLLVDLPKEFAKVLRLIQLPIRDSLIETLLDAAFQLASIRGAELFCLSGDSRDSSLVFRGKLSCCCGLSFDRTLLGRRR